MTAIFFFLCSKIPRHSILAGGDGAAAQAADVVSASGRGALAGAVVALPNLPAGLAQWFQQHQQHPQPTGGPGEPGGGPLGGSGPALSSSCEEWQARVTSGTDVLYGALLPHASHIPDNQAQHHFFQQLQ
jgi:hypothetical protein